MGKRTKTMGMAMHPSTSLLIFLLVTSSDFLFGSCLPFVAIHGFGDSCNGSGIVDDPTSIVKVKEILEKYSGAQGYCIEIGNGIVDSMYMPMMEQVTIACKKVKEKEELKAGYNLVAVSQGNIIGRGLIQLCDDAPPVQNYVSLAGPQAGIADFSGCKLMRNSNGAGFCQVVQTLLKKFSIYSSYFQAHIAPSNYLKIPTEIEAYLQGCNFLPKISNEIESTRNSAYKKRFASLKKLVLVKNEDDAVLTPKETAWFGYYPNGSTDNILLANETLLYKEDWIGLRSLDEAQKVVFLVASGGHASYTPKFLRDDIAPYLNDEAPQHVAFM